MSTHKTIEYTHESCRLCVFLSHTRHADPIAQSSFRTQVSARDKPPRGPALAWCHKVHKKCTCLGPHTAQKAYDATKHKMWHSTQAPKLATPPKWRNDVTKYAAQTLPTSRLAHTTPNASTCRQGCTNLGATRECAHEVAVVAVWLVRPHAATTFDHMPRAHSTRLRCDHVSTR